MLMVKTEMEYQKSKFRHEKYLRWYVQAHLSGIQKVIVGQKDAMNHVNHVVSYNMDELRRRCSNIWNREECVTFLWNVMEKVGNFVLRYKHDFWGLNR